MFGRNVQMVSFELASSQEVFFVGDSEKRSTYTNFETQERPARFRVPIIALLIKATMHGLYEKYWQVAEIKFRLLGFMLQVGRL